MLLETMMFATIGYNVIQEGTFLLKLIVVLMDFGELYWILC